VKRARVITALSLMLAAGCGSDPPHPPPVEDMALARDQRLARLSFRQQRPDQAATLYRQALARAQQRDDLAAIARLGYELAVVELRRDQAADALAVARSTRTEMTRRGSEPPPELLLVEAAALYRTGDGEQADALALVVETPGATGEARSRALFVRGLVAADRGDASGLADALAALPPSDDVDLRADRAELEGRLYLLQADPQSARHSLLSAAEARREAFDYSGMARALALAGKASEAAGRSAEAADLYLRAGRAAQLSGNEAQAKPWLTSARDLALKAGSSDVEGEAARLLSALGP
jgi:hypothetical protein